MAQTVVATLHDLSKRGKTILATIHQPSSEVYQMFDKYVAILKLHAVDQIMSTWYSGRPGYEVYN